jgi:hypothetical protein
MKRRSPLPRSIYSNAVTATATGEHCPATGWWIPQDTTEPWRYLSEGSVVPALDGRPATWVRAATDKMPEQPANQMPVRSLSPSEH